MYANSRYGDGATGDGHVFEDSHTKSVCVRRNWALVKRSGYSYVWREGDRLDQIAQRIGLPRTRWWMIMDVNPDIPNPFCILTGTTINLPETAPRVS